ncbi:MAG: tetratricopeptide repeat protein [Thermodesulfobacteriota bacterium]|nr:tetratricopeptide repeat protein [Thermodesulfobacteriota bacterium]
MTKESGILVPVLIGLIDYFFRNTLPRPLGVNIKTYLPLMAISVLYMSVRMVLLGRTDFTIGALDTSQTLPVIVITYAYYFKVLLFPVFQSANPVIIPPVLSVTDPAFITAFMLTALLVVVTVSCWNRFWELSFIILWICVTLLPVSGIVPLTVPALEHRLYLGSVCFSMVIPLVLYKSLLSGTKGFTLSSRSLCSAFILLALVLVYSAKTTTRNTIWQDEKTFWVHTLQASPSSAFAHNNLGIVYARQGNHDKAISIFKKGLSLPTTEAFSDRAATEGIRIKIYNNLGESYRALFEKQLAQEVKREEKALPGGGNTLDKPEGT